MCTKITNRTLDAEILPKVEHTSDYQVVIGRVDCDGQKNIYAAMQPPVPQETLPSMSVGMEVPDQDPGVSKTMRRA